jgi:hypothetical protein
MAPQDPGASAFRETLDSVFAAPAYRWGEIPAPLRDCCGSGGTGSAIGWSDSAPTTPRLPPAGAGLLLALLLVPAWRGPCGGQQAAARHDQRLPAGRPASSETAPGIPAPPTAPPPTGASSKRSARVRGASR